MNDSPGRPAASAHAPTPRTDPIDLTAETRVTDRGLELDLIDARPETAELFEGLCTERRAALVRDAWSIGLRALSNACAAARESRLETIGQDLMATLETKLQERLGAQQDRIDAVLREFFDPRDGRVYDRLARFVGDDGTLHRQLERFAEPEDGPLARALARQVGEASPLARLLSESDREGLFHKLEERLDEVLRRGRGELGGALDPTVPESPISRFLAELRAELRRSGVALDEKLAKALAALDTSDETSLLSRLSREVADAQRQMLAAVNLQSPESPLAALGHGLRETIRTQADAQERLLRQQGERQERFQVEVSEALARMQARKEADELGPRGGLAFERAVEREVARATARSACTVTPMGHETGAVPRAKVGDLVVEFDVDSAFAGSRVVVEAKREAEYTVRRALDQSRRARENRRAEVGVFVLERSRAKEGFPTLARHGTDVLVQWCADDPTTDAWLHAAILLALGLAARASAAEDRAGIEALEVLGRSLTAEIARLEKMEGLNRKVSESSRSLAVQLREARGTFEDLLRRGQDALRALDVEMLDHQALSFHAAANDARALGAGDG